MFIAGPFPGGNANALTFLLSMPCLMNIQSLFATIMEML
jgi:hypothetical protein